MNKYNNIKPIGLICVNVLSNQHNNYFLPRIIIKIYVYVQIIEK